MERTFADRPDIADNLASPVAAANTDNLRWKFNFEGGAIDHHFGNHDTYNWYHIAVIWDGTTLRAYKNGVSDWNTSTSTGFVDWGSRATTSVAVGDAANSFGWFDGYVDEVRIYDRSLTEEQINREMDFNDKLTFTYDANGNMTDSDGQTMVWNAQNRLQSVEAADPPQADWIEIYVYDADGRRVAKKYWDGSTTSTTLYVNGMWERYPDDNSHTINISLGSKFIASYNKVGTTTDLNFQFTDHLGSPVASGDPAVLSADGEDTRGFGSFGTVTYQSASFDSGEINFTGQRRDANTGLGFYNARYYDSETARFISADSIVPGATRGDAFNRYAYVSNNPLRYTDPSGHCAYAIPCTPFIDFERLADMGMDFAYTTAKAGAGLATDVAGVIADGQEALAINELVTFVAYSKIIAPDSGTNDFTITLFAIGGTSVGSTAITLASDSNGDLGLLVSSGAETGSSGRLSAGATGGFGRSNRTVDDLVGKSTQGSVSGGGGLGGSGSVSRGSNGTTRLGADFGLVGGGSGSVQEVNTSPIVILRGFTRPFIQMRNNILSILSRFFNRYDPDDYEDEYR